MFEIEMNIPEIKILMHALASALNILIYRTLKIT